MPKTFQEIYTDVQQSVLDEDTVASLPFIKRAINEGASKFMAILNREWRNEEKTFSLVADQQFYQMPEDAIRLKTVRVTISNITYPLTLIENEDEWNFINMYENTETSDIPEFFYVKGADQFGIYPVPSSAVANAGKINYEPRFRDMSADDYTTGTVGVTNGDATVTGSGTTFTQAMVGRTLLVEDSSSDHRIPYKIASVTDGTNLELENTWAGITKSSLSYRIGEVPDIPGEFHESLVDYGSYRFYRRRGDEYAARDLKAAFDEALEVCKTSYGSKTSSQYVRSPRYSRQIYTHNYRKDTII